MCYVSFVVSVSVACCLLCWLLSVAVCGLLFGIWCARFTVCTLRFVVRCLRCVACCLDVGCYLLCVVCCVRFGLFLFFLFFSCCRCCRSAAAFDCLVVLCFFMCLDAVRGCSLCVVRCLLFVACSVLCLVFRICCLRLIAVV